MMDLQFFNTLYINWFRTGPLPTVTAVILTILDSNSQRYSSSKSTPSYHLCREAWPPCMVDMRVGDCAGYHLGVSDSPSCWYRSLKGQCHEIFRFRFFSSISFPPAPEYPIRTVSKFFEKFAEIFPGQG